MVEKVRQSNIELCRIASILLVMLVHTTSQSLGDDMSFGALMLEAFSVIGVNVFVLITGYFSASPKKTSLLNLAFICMFWMVIKVVCRYELGQPLSYKYSFFVTSSNWFIANYIGLLFLTPILNKFCSTVSRRTLLGGGVLSLLSVEVWFDLLPPNPAVSLGTQKGYSVYSFMVLYLLARYIRLYGIPEWFKKYSLWIYLICSIVLGVVAYLGNVAGYGAHSILFAYSSPVVVLSSVAFLMTFERVNIQSKFINHIAKSTLAILLGHSAIFFLYTKQFKYLYEHYTGMEVVCYWALAIAIVFVASILIDQLRLLLWKPISGWLTVHIKNNNIF